MKSQDYIISCDEGFIKIWDLMDYNCVGSLQNNSSIKFLMPLNNGLIASASDLSLKIWDLAKGTGISHKDKNLDGIKCLELIKKNKLASGHLNGNICVWDLEKLVLYYATYLSMKVKYFL